ncbi:MAG: hypothetical protein AB1547_08895 [Thermodesulfobacteriota bacterium]
MEYRNAELQDDVFQTNMDEASPPDPTISGGFKHVFAAVSKGFPSHPAYARHLRKARENRLFATPSSLMVPQKVGKSRHRRMAGHTPFSLQRINSAARARKGRALGQSFDKGQ